ncbi:hypothetical protein SEVIR_6G125300v4 [Setaria viridis]|uniref:Histone-lysine N-methyltransferase NSD-like PHD zinc finger domain-containing protein n=2 Tax=Setaria TaxID=4554 RepID=A0A368RKT9_SETIT|nr:protein ENHANCED DOWNY MILDEW 2-like [Setaria viridis]RCV30688.1 hypothetical protein SETIT_6G115300v2 [Setaria italica]TKW09786.1 hypothetical protein SEVIR_6G125300v2 [Setaria viridis]
MEGEGGGESPNGVVIDPVWYGGAEGFYNGNAELNDVVCNLCGDGGELLCCEGPCLRSYHATRVTGGPSGCRSLGYTTEQVQAMRHFLCWSCANRQHRCAMCGARGSSSELNAQVFRCDHDTCGRFYHPVCISAQLHPGDPAEAARCRVRIAAGRPFWCPGPHRPRVLVFHD